MQDDEKQEQAKEYLTRFGKKALLQASGQRDVDICRILMSECDVNFTDQQGGTALIYAALNGSYDICQLLIQGNADVNAACGHGWTPLMYAASKGGCLLFEFFS